MYLFLPSFKNFSEFTKSTDIQVVNIRQFGFYIVRWHASKIKQLLVYKRVDFAMKNGFI